MGYTTTDIGENLKQDLEDAKLCEIEGHFEDNTLHYGPGAWYVVMKCPDCGAEDGEGRGVIIVCDSIKNFAEQLTELSSCHVCKAIYPYNAVIQVLGKVSDFK